VTKKEELIQMREQLDATLKDLDELEAATAVPDKLLKDLVTTIDGLKVHTKRQLRQNELAGYMSISEATLARHKMYDKIPHAMVGNTRVYRKDVVDWFLDSYSLRDIEDPLLAQEFQKRFLREG
jgi:hypothetical protein